MRLLASLSAIVLVCCSPAFAKRRALPDQIVATPVGNIRITEIKCDHPLGYQFVQGKIVNESNKSWDALYLAMEFHDKNGIIRPKEKPDPLILIQEPSASAGLIANAFGIGATLKFKYQGSAKADNDTFSVTFKFADGRYPVHYRTALTKPISASSLEFHDDVLAISFSLQRTEIDFVLQNNSNDPIKVDWNLVTYISGSGSGIRRLQFGTRMSWRETNCRPTGLR
jgi:hypothetical protein